MLVRVLAGPCCASRRDLARRGGKVRLTGPNGPCATLRRTAALRQFTEKNGSRGSSVWLSVAVLLPCLHVFTYMVCAAINRGLLIFSAAFAA